jgi:hypothetical protein
MPCRLAALILLGVLSACDAPPRVEKPVPPERREKPAAAPLSKLQVDDRSALCGKMSRDQFLRAWKDGGAAATDGDTKAEFTHHYNAKLNTCFYLLTVASAGTLKKMLFDINGGELYGEYLGAAVGDSQKPAMPKACRVESFYCASEREWHVLIAPYMED